MSGVWRLKIYPPQTEPISAVICAGADKSVCIVMLRCVLESCHCTLNTVCHHLRSLSTFFQHLYWSLTRLNYWITSVPASNNNQFSILDHSSSFSISIFLTSWADVHWWCSVFICLIGTRRNVNLYMFYIITSQQAECRLLSAEDSGLMY